MEWKCDRGSRKERDCYEKQLEKDRERDHIGEANKMVEAHTVVVPLPKVVSDWIEREKARLGIDENSPDYCGECGRVNHFRESK